MRILQLCNRVPYPTKDGWTLAALNLTRAFIELGHEVCVLAMNTTRHRVDLETIPDELRRKASIIAVEVDNRVRLHGALGALLRNKSYNIERFNSKTYAEVLSHLLFEKKYDVVQLEGLYLSPYLQTIRENSSAKIALRAHNVEHLIWSRNAHSESNPLKRMYYKILARQLRSVEGDALNACDLLVPISPVDAQMFAAMGSKIPWHVCPASFDFDLDPESSETTDAMSMFFIGSLDWIPNREGLLWMVEHVWPRVSAEFPELRFDVAGRHPPKKLLATTLRNLEILGEVESARDFVSKRSIAVVPLFSGSGMRVKIVESMAMGKTVISTTIGAEGIGCEDGQNILLADDAETFVAQIRRCLLDPEWSRSIGRRAKEFAWSRYSPLRTAKGLLDFYMTQLRVPEGESAKGPSC